MNSLIQGTRAFKADPLRIHEYTFYLVLPFGLFIFIKIENFLIVPPDKMYFVRFPIKQAVAGIMWTIEGKQEN